MCILDKNKKHSSDRVSLNYPYFSFVLGISSLSSTIMCCTFKHWQCGRFVDTSIAIIIALIHYNGINVTRRSEFSAPLTYGTTIVTRVARCWPEHCYTTLVCNIFQTLIHSLRPSDPSSLHPVADLHTRDTSHVHYRLRTSHFRHRKH